MASTVAAGPSHRPSKYPGRCPGLSWLAAAGQVVPAQYHNGPRDHASSKNGEIAPVIVVDPGSAADPVHSSATCQVSNGLRAAAAHHRGRDQPLIVRPAAVPVRHLRHQPGPAERVRPLPARARAGADRWNIGPHQAGPVEHRAGDCASRRPHRPLQAPWFRGQRLPGPPRLSCSRDRGSGSGFPDPPDRPPSPDPPREFGSELGQTW
jgi:hypothetical protein